MDTQELVDYTESLCTSIENIDKYTIKCIERRISKSISLTATCAATRVFFYIEVRNQPDKRLFLQEDYKKLHYLLNNSESGWNKLCSPEKAALLQHCHLTKLFVFVNTSIMDSEINKE
jgi:hypothetical protein